MVGAMITHGRLGQLRFVMLNVAYLALAAFVAWGRFGPEPFRGLSPGRGPTERRQLRPG